MTLKRWKKPVKGETWRERGGRLVVVVGVFDPRGPVPAYVRVEGVSSERESSVRLDRFRRLYRRCK